MTDAPSDPLMLLRSSLGEVRQSGNLVWITLLPIVDEPRSEEVEDALLDLVSRHEQITLDFTNVRNIGSDWLRLLKRLSIEGSHQGVGVRWHAVPEIVRQTADWLGIVAGLEFDDPEVG